VEWLVDCSGGGSPQVVVTPTPTALPRGFKMKCQTMPGIQTIA
jgi:hypothetical protein